MHWPSSLTIGTRLSLSSAALSAALVVIVVALGAAAAPRESRLDQGGSIIAGQLADGATEYILDKDNLALQALLNDLTRQSLITFASVEDATHSVLAESHYASVTSSGVREFSSPIQIHDTIVGYARIGLVGPSAPLLPSSVILFLGILVFTAAFALMQLFLRRFHSTLQLVSDQLGIDYSHHRSGTFKELDRICEALEQMACKIPQCPATQRAALALRIPGLEHDTLEPPRLARLIQALRQLAQRQNAELHLRADGCLLLFTTGDAVCSRALQSAQTLQSLLAGDHGYSMAIAREDRTNDPDKSVEYIAHWQQLCEQTYQLATRENSLLLCRSALSDPGICDKVTVSQDDSGHFQVTAFGGIEENEPDHLQNDNPPREQNPVAENSVGSAAAATG